ncbi:hypothetical protein NQ152_15985 [Microbacterium sp. zg.B48]|nr:hypothetical protein [Microbacterium sp. zg.B48]MCR2765006.1 hypothetical protein [Microbacterium sp. zg.B48]
MINEIAHEWSYIFGVLVATLRHLGGTFDHDLLYVSPLKGGLPLYNLTVHPV